MLAPRATLVGVNALGRLALEELLNRLLDARHARHPADEDGLFDVFLVEAGVGQRLPADVDRALDEIGRQLFERLSVDRPLEVEGLVPAARDDEGKVDLGLVHARELALGLLGRVLQSLEGHAILPEIDSVLLLEALDEPIDDSGVHVLAAEERVARGGDDLEDAARADLEDGDVERAAAEVVDGDCLLDVLAEPVRQGRRRGFVDDSQDVEAGNLARVFRRLPLVVVEVSRDGDHRLAHGLAEIVLGDELHLLEHHRAHFGDAVLLFAKDDAHVVVRSLHDAIARRRHRVLDLGRVPFAADESLGRVNGVLGVGDRLPLGDVPDEPLSLPPVIATIEGVVL